VRAADGVGAELHREEPTADVRERGRPRLDEVGTPDIDGERNRCPPSMSGVPLEFV
jgi:hypothetical protein